MAEIVISMKTADHRSLVYHGRALVIYQGGPDYRPACPEHAPQEPANC